MTREELDRADERRHRNAERDARDREVLDPHTANAVAKIRRDRETRDRQFKKWDELLATDEFGAFLGSRGLRVEEAWSEPPYDVMAEMSVIGAICMDGEAARIVVGPLRPAHFREHQSHHALCAIAALIQKQCQGKTAPIDLVTIASEMQKQKTFVKPGDGVWSTGDFLTECVNVCPGSANVEAYVEAVMSAARLRFIHWLGCYLSRAALLPNIEAEQLINASRLALDAIETRGLANIDEIFKDIK